MPTFFVKRILSKHEETPNLHIRAKSIIHLHANFSNQIIIDQMNLLYMTKRFKILALFGMNG